MRRGPSRGRCASPVPPALRHLGLMAGSAGVAAAAYYAPLGAVVGFDALWSQLVVGAIADGSPHPDALVGVARGVGPWRSYLAGAPSLVLVTIAMGSCAAVVGIALRHASRGELTPAGSLVLANEEESLAFAAGAFGAPMGPEIAERLVDAFRTGIGLSYEDLGPNAASQVRAVIYPHPPFQHVTRTTRRRERPSPEAILSEPEITRCRAEVLIHDPNGLAQQIHMGNDPDVSDIVGDSTPDDSTAVAAVPEDQQIVFLGWLRGFAVGESGHVRARSRLVPPATGMGRKRHPVGVDLNRDAPGIFDALKGKTVGRDRIEVRVIVIAPAAQ